MIESPLLQEWMQEKEIATLQSVVLKKLEKRFGSVPADVSPSVRVVTNQSKFETLLDVVYSSATLDAFRQTLTSPQTSTANTNFSNPTN